MTSSMGSTAIRLRPASRRASKSSCVPGRKTLLTTLVRHGITSTSHAARARFNGRTRRSTTALPRPRARRWWRGGACSWPSPRQPLVNCARAIKSYRDERAEVGNLAGGGDAIMARDVYVAETDEQAWKEAGPEVTRFWQLATDNVWRGDSIKTDDLPKFTERFAYFPGGLTLKRMDEWGTSLIGSPETVVKKARLMIETARPDSLVGMFSFGGLSHEQVMRSIELFATKVMPALGA